MFWVSISISNLLHHFSLLLLHLQANLLVSQILGIPVVQYEIKLTVKSCNTVKICDPAHCLP